VINVVPDGSPESTLILSLSAPKMRKIKQSSTVVVTEGQVGEADLPEFKALVFMGVTVSWPVTRTIKLYASSLSDHVNV